MLRRLVFDQSGSGGAEFVLVLPLLVLFLFGVIDTGRFIWSYNQAEKATHMGVRYAVATDLVPSGLATYSFAGSGGVPAGSPVPSNSSAGTAWFGTATCTNTACTCTGTSGVCGTHNATAFANIVSRMTAVYGSIAASNVQVEYRNVGLGYAGDPNGPDVAPLVTVRLTGMTFKPLTLMFFKANMAMPDFRAALTLEDGSGTGSN
jgi:Flp pilus assembly protein TadG